MSAASPPLKISDGIRAHIHESTGTILVGTRSADLTPRDHARGWGPTILPDGHTIDVCISLSAGAKTLENLCDSDEVAVTFCHTSTYKAVQLKGRFVESGELTPRDLEAFERQKNIFLEQTKVFGILLSIASRLFTPDLVRLR